MATSADLGAQSSFDDLDEMLAADRPDVSADFDGSDYDRETDRSRLAGQLLSVYAVEKRLISPGLWEYRVGEPGSHVPTDRSRAQEAIERLAAERDTAAPPRRVVPAPPQPGVRRRCCTAPVATMTARR